MRILTISFAILLPACLMAQPPSGIQNFQQVNEHIYRGAQPTYEGFKELAKMGVKTVVDLRNRMEQSRKEKEMVESLGMRFIGVPMTMRAPTDDQIKRVLYQLDLSSGWPVFVHCQGGRDRTGTVIACYRIAHDGWNCDKALDEARRYGMRPSDRGMRRYIRHYKGSTPAHSS